MEAVEMDTCIGRIKRTTISFVDFNKRIDELPDFEASTYIRSQWGRFALWTMVATAAIGLSINHWPLPDIAKIWIGGASLMLEVASLLVLIITTYREQIPGMAAPRREYAKQLDFDTSGHFDLLDWLIPFGTDVLNSSRDFTKIRRARMEQKLPLLIGASQSFGFLPLAGAIYLQAHEFSKVGRLGWLEGLSIFLLALLYYAGFTATVVKQRLDAMDMYLEEAVRLRIIFDSGKEIMTTEPLPNGAMSSAMDATSSRLGDTE